MKDTISKELLSEVTKMKIGYIRLEDGGKTVAYSSRFPNAECWNNKRMNVHELAYECKEKVREWGYIVLSGFNTDIIEDDGRLAIDLLQVDRYQVVVKKIESNSEEDLIKTIGFFGGNNLALTDIKACQWILDHKDNK